MPGFLPNFVETHQNLAREMGQKPFRLKRPTIQRFPLAAERGYVSALVGIIKAIRTDIDELLVPELGRISRESGLRGDELHEDTKRRENDLLRNAMRRGEVKRPSKCQRCGKAGKVDAHHSDYNKATKVRWLCRLCHETVHGRGLDNDPLKKDVADVSAVIQGIQDQVTVRMDNTHLRALDQLVSRYSGETSKFNRMQIARQIRRMIGFDAFPNEAGLKSILDLHLSQNVSLIKSLSGDYVGKVMDSVRRNVQAGARPEVIAQDIKKQFDVSMWRARFIARDQTNKLNGALTQMRQTGLGVEQYTWRTSRDERVRPTHRLKEGNVYSWDDPPADTGHPGHDFNCRCSAEPVLEGIPAQPEDKKAILAKMKAKRAAARKRYGAKAGVARESAAEERLLKRKAKPPAPAPKPAPFAPKGAVAVPKPVAAKVPTKKAGPIKPIKAAPKPPPKPKAKPKPTLAEVQARTAALEAKTAKAKAKAAEAKAKRTALKKAADDKAAAEAKARLAAAEKQLAEAKAKKAAEQKAAKEQKAKLAAAEAKVKAEIEAKKAAKKAAEAKKPKVAPKPSPKPLSAFELAEKKALAAEKAKLQKAVKDFEIAKVESRKKGQAKSPFDVSRRGNRPIDPKDGIEFDAVDSWVESSNTRSSVALKWGAKEEFGLDGIPFVRDPWQYSAQELRGARQTARRMWKKTQAEFKKQNVKTIRLYRGIVQEYKHPGAIESWTTDKSIAESFARGGKVLVEDVPVERILNGHKMKHWHNGSAGNEAEWMVMT